MIGSLPVQEIRTILIQLCLLFVIFLLFSILLSWSISLGSVRNVLWLSLPSFLKGTLEWYQFRLFIERDFAKDLPDKYLKISLLAFQTFLFYTPVLTMMIVTPILLKKFKGSIRMFLPQWTDKYMIFSRSSDEANVPPLEIDVTAKIEYPEVSLQTSQIRPHNVDQLVYDPSMGIILKSLQDLWTHQELERSALHERIKSKRKQTALPPIRS